MKNIYNMVYTVDNTKGMEEDFFDVDSVLDSKGSLLDIEQLFKMVEKVPDKKLIDKILAKAF